MSRYEKLVRRLYQINLHHPAKLGLTNTIALHEALGRPLDAFKVVHVAGTNGKGSVAFKVSKTLQLAGLKTGLFVSPHIACFRERMQVDGNMISEEKVNRLLPHVLDVMEREKIPATFFELTTLLSMVFFADSRADTVVLETGLGGKTDSTNICTPSLSVITTIGLEHTHILGHTIELIARQKAGIIKKGVPCLVGDKCPHHVMEEVAAAVGSPLFRVRDVLPSTPEPADFDEENSLLAEAAVKLYAEGRHLSIPQSCITEGVSHRPPCRFEILPIPVRAAQAEAQAAVLSHADSATATAQQEGPPTVVTVVLDVAHNPSALRQLRKKLDATFPGRPIRVVAGFSHDKDLGECLALILDLVGGDASKAHFIQASHPRATPSHVLRAALDSLARGGDAAEGQPIGAQVAQVGDGVRDALQAAAAAAASAPSAASTQSEGGAEAPSSDEVVVVCGSVFLMADAREALGLKEPRDSRIISEVAGAHLKAAQDNLGALHKGLKRHNEEGPQPGSAA